VILTAVLVIIYIAFAFAHGLLCHYAQSYGYLYQTSINGILAIGMTMCIVTAGIDMSRGSRFPFQELHPGGVLQGEYSARILSVAVCLISE
jgi:ribose/xylose/arabinose/galactoside ABC-type transport system permease subunit